MKPSKRPPSTSSHIPTTATTTDQPIKKSRAALVLSIASAVLLLLTAVGIYLLWPYIKDPPAFRKIVQDIVDEHYLLGALFLIFLSAIQVIVALIPGEALEIASGYVFGGLWGGILCAIGIMLGSVATILLVRRFGSKFVYAIYPKEKLDALPLLNDPKKRNTLVFVLFFIPGTPKDLLTYGIALTDMKISTYLLLTTLARFPSIIVSSIGGNAVGEQKYTNALIVFAISAIISLIGLLAYRQIGKWHQKKKHSEQPAAEDPTHESIQDNTP